MGRPGTDHETKSHELLVVVEGVADDDKLAEEVADRHAVRFSRPPAQWLWHGSIRQPLF